MAYLHNKDAQKEDGGSRVDYYGFSEILLKCATKLNTNNQKRESKCFMPFF